MAHKHLVTAYNRKKTKQTERIPGEKKQVKNSAGGYVYKVDSFDRMKRFLILGSEGGTYYVGERKLTQENAKNVLACIEKDPKKAVDLIVEVSDSGRAPKNDPALFALALAASAEAPGTRKLALAALPKVARIPTHLFHFAEFAEGMRGWGKGLRKAIGDWYNNMEPKKLAYELVKYQQRDGWSNRDLLRLAHPKPKTAQHQALFNYVVKGNEGTGYESLSEEPTRIVHAFETAKLAKEPRTLVKLIQDFGLTREMIPTEALQDVEVWDALLQKMPLTAMIRTLGKMTEVGLIQPTSAAAKTVRQKLLDGDYLKKSRVHPLAVLVAMKIYGQGHGDKGSLKWNPVQAIMDSLDEAFYLSFGNVEPVGKKQIIALDVSGSMGGGNVAGSPLTPREASVALAMVAARVEDPTDYEFLAFQDKLVPLNISPKMRLEEVVRKVSHLPFGGTDASLPILKALKAKQKVDSFTTITDNETWAGGMHVKQALKLYRDQFGPAKSVVIGMTATDFSINDPEDVLGLDVVGFDTAAPNVIADFIRG